MAKRLLREAKLSRKKMIPESNVALGYPTHLLSQESHGIGDDGSNDLCLTENSRALECLLFFDASLRLGVGSKPVASNFKAGK